MTRYSSTRVFFLLLGLVCLIASASIWPREYNSFYVSTRHPLDWVVAPTTVVLTKPSSVEGHYLLLQSCDQSMASISVSLAAQSDRERIAKSCADLTNSILRDGPSLSLAYLVRAQALFILDRNIAGFEALLASEQTGGAISWMATRRFDLAMARFEEAGQTFRTMMARDLARVMMSRGAGVSRVARLYDKSNSEALRQFIIETIETLPNERQHRFVTAVRQAS